MKRRGFTLIELMLVVAMTSIVAGAIGAFYLEVRATGATIEAQVQLERRASLALEALARDMRGARTSVTPEQLTLQHSGAAPVRWRVEDGRLLRSEGASTRVLARGARGLFVQGVSGGHRVRLVLGRRVTRSRDLEIEREVFVGLRR